MWIELSEFSLGLYVANMAPDWWLKRRFRDKMVTIINPCGLKAVCGFIVKPVCNSMRALYMFDMSIR